MSVSDNCLSCYKSHQEENDMCQTKTNNKISARLNPTALQQLQDAQSKGYTTSQYINDLINGTSIIDIGQHRQLIQHLCELERLLEFEKDDEQKDAMRGELNKLWRCLKSFPETT